MTKPETARPTVPSPRLFELTAELTALHDELEALEGEITPELDSRITEVLVGLEGKVDAIAYIVRTFEYQAGRHKAAAAAITAQAEPHLAREKHYTRRAKELKGYLLLHLRSIEKVKLAGELHAIRRQANTPRVVLDVDERFLPERFLKPREADRTALSEALKAGDEEAKQYAHLDRGEHVQVTVS